MVTQVTSETGWFGRIGGAIKGIFFGILLVVVSLVLLVFNERNAVRDIVANNEIAEKVVTVASERIDPSQEARLVHLNGRATTDDFVRNETFGVEENAIRLEWKARIYQWVEDEETRTEKKVGGGERKVTTYTYEKKWVDEPVDSSRFHEKGHDNGTGRTYDSGSSQAGLVTLGAFRLPPALVAKIGGAESYALSRLPPALADKGRLVGGVFHTGDPGQPRIGDEKVEFLITRPADVSVMATQAGESFVPYVAKNGKEKFLLEDGLLSAAEMVARERSKAKVLRWALRIGGLFLMFFGFTLILRPLSVLADVIPFIGNLVGGATGFVSFLLAFGISALVIAVSWVTFRPLIGIPLLVLGVGALAWLIVRMARSRAPAPEPMPPPAP